MTKLLLTCLLFLAGLGLSTSASAAECTEITAVAQTISAPGHYCLGADLATGQTGITINASHVDLDCRGYSLRSTNTNSAQNTYGVYINGQTDVHVHHCHISGGHAAGIYAYQNNGLANVNQNLSFHDNTISGAFWYGILAYGTGIDIRDNLINRIGGRASFAMGIRVGASTLSGERHFHVVRDNTVSDVASPVNNGYGIYSNNSDESLFADNTVVGMRGPFTGLTWGIRIMGGARNSLTGNHVIGRMDGFSYGIVIEGDNTSTGNKCYHNDLRADYPKSGCDDFMGLGNF